MMRSSAPLADGGNMYSLVRRVAGVAFFVMAGLIAGPVDASPMHETYGGWGSLTPFQARVLPGGMDATYFNPALLVDTAPGAQVGFVVLHDDLRIRLRDRHAGADVSDAIYDARAVNPDGSTRRLDWRPLPTASLRFERSGDAGAGTRGFLTLGANLHVVPDRLAVGFHMLVPTKSFQTQRSHFSDEREQYFSNALYHELYGDRLETNLVSFGVAGRVVDELSIGLGATMANEGVAKNEAFVPDASDQGVVVMNTSVEVRTRFRPYAGIDVRPVEPLHAVATVHLPHANDTAGTNELQLWNFAYDPGQSSFMQGFDYQSHSMPLRAALGVGWRPKRSGPLSWTASTTAVWTQWSEYRDRHRERPLDAWYDTFSFAAGGTMRWDDHRLGLDATYVPSPVPDQTGRTNYVDNDRVAGAVGYALCWELSGVPFEAGIQLQVHRLLSRSVVKSSDASHPVVDEFPDSVDIQTGDPIADSAGLQTNNPGYPGFSSEGWLVGAGMNLSSRF
jgi:hypothetical protein